MSELKTKPNNASVRKFLNSISDGQKRQDSLEVLRMMETVAGEKPRMWGPGIVGSGSYHCNYACGREGDWPLTGFSPRNQNLTLYIMPGFKRYPELMKILGMFRTGSSCLYIKRQADVDRKVLRDLVKNSVDHMRKACPA